MRCVTCLNEYLSNVEDVSQGDGVGGLAWGSGGYARTDRPRVEDVVLHVRVYCETGDPRSTRWGSQAFK